MNNNQLIIKLKLLSKLQVGDKIEVNNDDFIIIKPSLTSSIYRWYMKHDRTISIIYLENLFANIQIAIEELLQQPDSDGKTIFETKEILMEQFKVGVQSALNGLSNLKFTYATDPMIITRLENIEKRCSIILDRL